MSLHLFPLLFLVLGVFSDEVPYKCIHDQKQKNIIPDSGRFGARQTVEFFFSFFFFFFNLVRINKNIYIFKASNVWLPIRIVADYSRLTAGADTGTDYTVLTTEKATFLKETLMPKAIAYLQSSLSVNRFTTALSVGTSDCVDIVGTSIQSPYSSPGVDADFIIFVTARGTDATTLAWAAYCRMLNSGRPYAGQVNFGPVNLDPSPAALDAQVATAVHEILHALGFSSSSFAYFKAADGSSAVGSTTSNGVARSTIKTAKVLDKARQHYGCTTLAGVPLEEGGSAGSAGSHWESRVAFDEIMNPRGTTYYTVSEMTLALMEDSTWYKADYSSAFGFQWGRNQGCTFVDGSCSLWTRGGGGYFCETNGAPGCYMGSKYHKASCNVVTYASAISPANFQYFVGATGKGGPEAFTDYCPVSYPNAAGPGASCRGASSYDDPSIYGEDFGSDKATVCAMGTLLKDGYTGVTAERAMCVTFNCRPSTVTAGVTDLWLCVGTECQLCAAPGQQLTGFTGIAAGRYIRCPMSAQADICPSPGTISCATAPGATYGEGAVTFSFTAGSHTAPGLSGAVYRVARSSAGAADCATAVGDYQPSQAGAVFPVTGLTPGASYLFCAQIVLTPAAAGTSSYAISGVCSASASNNADLSALVVSVGGTAVTLTPAFASATVNYQVTLPALPATGFKVRATTSSTAVTTTLAINTVVTASGVDSAASFNPAAGTTLRVDVVVTSGSVIKTYSVSVFRLNLNTVANLQSITLTPAAALSPAFSSAVTSYAVNVPYSVTTVTVTATTVAAASLVTVTYAPGATANSLAVGTASTVTITSVAESGATLIYTVRITRQSDTVSTLSALALSGLTLSPAFSSAVTSYTAITAASGTTTTTYTATSADATVTVTPTATGATIAAAAVTTISATVTAQNTAFVTTYTVVITSQSTTAVSSLSSLLVSDGSVALSPAFAAGTTAYTATVPFTTTSATIKATTLSSTSTMTVQGTAVTSGTASGAVSLAVGATVISVVVTSSGGSSATTYRVTVTRSAASTVTTLSSLALVSPAMALSPTFASGTLSYTASCGFTVTAVSVTPTATSGSFATIAVNSVAVASGATTATPVTLAVGQNVILVVVTAQDGATQATYQVTVTRSNDANANLATLNVLTETLALSPVFQADVTVYTVDAGFEDETVSFSVTTASTVASVKLNGASVAVQGAALGPFAVNPGETKTFLFVVTAPAPWTQTYSVAVTRALSPYAGFDAVQFSPKEASITTTTAPATPDYYANNGPFDVYFPYEVTSASMKADCLAYLGVTCTVIVDSLTLPPGSFSAAKTLTVGTPVTVTALAQPQDPQVTPLTFIFRFNRLAASAVKDVSTLRLAQGPTVLALTPTFDPAVAGPYDAVGPYSVTDVDVTFGLASSVSTATLNGVAVGSGVQTTIALTTIGAATTITIIVTAQDASTKTYTVRVTRTAASAIADLSGVSLSPSSVVLGATWASGTTSYTATAPFAASSVRLTLTLGSSLIRSVTAGGATVPLTVSSAGVKTGVTASIPLAVGSGASNTITLVVTPEASTPTKSYSIAFTRAGDPDATLRALQLSPGVALVYPFHPSNTTIVASCPYSVTSTTVTPTANSTAAVSVTVNSVAVASGSASAAIQLPLGPSEIRILVTPQSLLPTRQVTVVVTRDSPSANASLTALTASPSFASLSPSAWSASVTSYTATVPFEVSSVTLTATRASSFAAVVVNGVPGASSTLSLRAGGTTTNATFLVTAEAGNIQRYVVLVTRLAASTVNDLSSLTIRGATFTPTFTAGTLAYNITNTLVSTATAFVAVAADAPRASVAISPATIPAGGPTVVTITVTPQSSTPTKVYQVTVFNRLPSPSSDLSSLAVATSVPGDPSQTATLAPAFSSSVTSYTLSGFPANATAITFAPRTRYANSIEANVSVLATVAGAPALMAADGTLSVSAPTASSTTLSVSFLVQTVMNATLNLTTRYTVVITSPQRAPETSLASLTVTAADSTALALSPAFTAQGAAYSASAPFEVAFVTLRAAPKDPQASVDLVGSGPVATSAAQLLIAGQANVFNLLVTAAGGAASRPVTVTVTRPAPPTSNTTAEVSVKPTAVMLTSAGQKVTFLALAVGELRYMLLDVNGGGVNNVTLTVTTTESRLVLGDVLVNPKSSGRPQVASAVFRGSFTSASPVISITISPLADTAYYVGLLYRGPATARRVTRAAALQAATTSTAGFDVVIRIPSSSVTNTTALFGCAAACPAGKQCSEGGVCTAVAVSTASAAPAASSAVKKKLSRGAIIGIAVGCSAAFVILVIVIACACGGGNKQEKQKPSPLTDHQHHHHRHAAAAAGAAAGAAKIAKPSEPPARKAKHAVLDEDVERENRHQMIKERAKIAALASDASSSAGSSSNSSSSDDESSSKSSNSSS
jgi:hypothetical protein